MTTLLPISADSWCAANRSRASHACTRLRTRSIHSPSSCHTTLRPLQVQPWIITAIGRKLIEGKIDQVGGARGGFDIGCYFIAMRRVAPSHTILPAAWGCGAGLSGRSLRRRARWGVRWHVHGHRRDPSS
jgi:hypothetical protein